MPILLSYSRNVNEFGQISIASEIRPSTRHGASTVSRKLVYLPS